MAGGFGLVIGHLDVKGGGKDETGAFGLFLGAGPDHRAQTLRQRHRHRFAGQRGVMHEIDQRIGPRRIKTRRHKQVILQDDAVFRVGKDALLEGIDQQVMGRRCRDLAVRHRHAGLRRVQHHIAPGPAIKLGASILGVQQDKDETPARRGCGGIGRGCGHHIGDAAPLDREILGRQGHGFTRVGIFKRHAGQTHAIAKDLGQGRCRDRICIPAATAICGSPAAASPAIEDSRNLRRSVIGAPGNG